MSGPELIPPMPDVPTPEIKIDPFNDDLPAEREPVSAAAFEDIRKQLWLKAFEFSTAFEQMVLAVGWVRGQEVLNEIGDGLVFSVGEDLPALIYRNKRLVLELPLDPHCRDTRQMLAREKQEDAEQGSAPEGGA